MDNIQQRFKDLLKKLFQFESADLDFGIYRILNYKRDKLEYFVEKELVGKIESTFYKHKSESLESINQKIQETKKRVIETLGNDAITSTDDIKEEYKNTPIGKEYLSVKSKKDEIERLEEIKTQIFNDLYNFFSRYYEDGDFIPKYRYSIKGHKYAIPYNGEEIKLYWANADQYYIKTGVFFRDYTFKANRYRVIFRTVSAKEEQGSNKSTKERFFLLDDETPISLEDRKLTIRFQYRELTEKEAKKYNIGKGSNFEKQRKINEEIYQEILQSLDKISDMNLKETLTKELFLYQLNRFTSKNTKDYFIHKDLKRFLSEQLDYFIKSEVLDIEILEKESFLDKHIARAKLVREIGENIIDFLSQIENFQKRLWEKKKFVINTEYVITIDRIQKYAGEEFLNSILDEILSNKEQLNEWKELGFGEIKNKQELLLKDNLLEKEYKRLPIDTRYFSQEFKERLLEKITENFDLDDILDGLLIKSENWQAMNLLSNKYREKIQTIYIDPPYNTGNDGFLYRDNFQHSSWLTMMENRLNLARDLMKDKGIIFVSIASNLEQYNETYKLGLQLENMFPRRIIDIIWKRRSGSGSYVISGATEVHEYIMCYGRENAELYKNLLPSKSLKEYTHEDKKGVFKWHSLVINQYTKEERPNLYYGVVYNFVKDELLFDKAESDINPEEEVVIYPSKDGKSVWTMTKESMKEVHERGVIKVLKNKKGEYEIKIKKYLLNIDGMINGYPIKSVLEDEDLPWEVGTTAQATKELKDLFPKFEFNTAKPVNLIKTLLYVSTWKHDVILDFFAGTGTTAHAVISLNKEDGAMRKFILVEMANYFDTIVIPRIKKVAYSPNWKEGKPQDSDGTGVFFKYHYIEQYEDTLDNIELKQNDQLENLFKDEYLLKYFLDFETRESPCLLNFEMLKEPFQYKLKVNFDEVGEPQETTVDIPETFNYLLGLKVKKVKTKYNNERKYLFILGEKEGRSIVIIWREYNDSWTEEDFKEDREFILKEIENWAPNVVYINGQSVLVPSGWEVKYIEPDFKRLMEL